MKKKTEKKEMKKTKFILKPILHNEVNHMIHCPDYT